MNGSHFGLAAALILACAAPAAAQAVSIQFQNGLVSLDVRDAPVRTVLAEWARVGGATIVNGDRVAGAPVTLELTNVPERQALEVLLRDVSGYIVGARAQASTGASAFDRILILPTSTVSSVAQAPTRQGPLNQPVTVFVPQDEFVPEDTVGFDPNTPFNANHPFSQDQDQDQDQQRRIRQLQERLSEAARTAGERPIESVVQEPFVDDVDPPAPAVTPGNPFGTIQGSKRPGEITPAPQSQQPGGPQ